MTDFDLDLDTALTDDLAEHARLVRYATFLAGFLAGVLVCTVLVALARF